MTHYQQAYHDILTERLAIARAEKQMWDKYLSSPAFDDNYKLRIIDWREETLEYIRKIEQEMEFNNAPENEKEEAA